MCNVALCPYAIRSARILAGEIPVKLSTLERGAVFVVYIGVECGILLDKQALIRTPADVMGHFYRLDRYGGPNQTGVWFRAVRRDSNAPNGWAPVHTRVDMPFGCSPDIHVYIVEGRQKTPPIPLPKVQPKILLPEDKQLTLNFPT